MKLMNFFLTNDFFLLLSLLHWTKMKIILIFIQPQVTWVKLQGHHHDQVGLHVKSSLISQYKHGRIVSVLEANQDRTLKNPLYNRLFGAFMILVILLTPNRLAALIPPIKKFGFSTFNTTKHHKFYFYFLFFDKQRRLINIRPLQLQPRKAISQACTRD